MKGDDLYAVHDFDIDLTIQLPIQMYNSKKKEKKNVNYFVNIL